MTAVLSPSTIKNALLRREGVLTLTNDSCRIFKTVLHPQGLTSRTKRLKSPVSLKQGAAIRDRKVSLSGDGTKTSQRLDRRVFQATHQKQLALHGEAQVICRLSFSQNKSATAGTVTEMVRITTAPDGQRMLFSMKSLSRNTLKQDGKVFGVLTDNVLRIIKTSQSHYVRRYKGYGVSPETLDEAEARGCAMLELIGYDGEKYTLPIEDFRKAAIPDNLGFGRQLFLSVRWLRYYTEREDEKAKPRQLSFTWTA